MKTEKLVKIDVWIPNAETLQKIIATTKMKYEEARPHTDEQGNPVSTFYGSLADAKKMTKYGYRYEIDETFGEELLKRQQEVSKIDRFKGGKIKPTGLGIKK